MSADEELREIYLGADGLGALYLGGYAAIFNKGFMEQCPFVVNTARGLEICELHCRHHHPLLTLTRTPPFDDFQLVQSTCKERHGRRSSGSRFWRWTGSMTSNKSCLWTI